MRAMVLGLLFFGAACSNGLGNDPQGTDDGGASADLASGPDPLNAAPTCTSMQDSTATRGYTMEPGGACNACHRQYGVRRFTAAGTVYPTGHEPEPCMGTSGAQIILTDANGVDLPALTTNIAGNFTYTGTLALPYTARVVVAGKSRPMTTPQMDGDCNSCHTQDGAQNAPGRITVPAP